MAYEDMPGVEKAGTDVISRSDSWHMPGVEKAGTDVISCCDSWRVRMSYLCC